MAKRTIGIKVENVSKLGGYLIGHTNYTTHFSVFLKIDLIKQIENLNELSDSPLDILTPGKILTKKELIHILQSFEDIAESVDSLYDRVLTLTAKKRSHHIVNRKS